MADEMRMNCGKHVTAGCEGNPSLVVVQLVGLLWVSDLPEQLEWTRIKIENANACRSKPELLPEPNNINKRMYPFLHSSLHISRSRHTVSIVHSLTLY
jgi:hypothetical protein